MSSGCGVTVLQARGRRLCKTIRPGGEVIGYDSAKTLDLRAVSLATLTDLHALVHDLAGRTDCALVRGTPISPEHSRGVRRLLYDDAETGDAATLLDVPRRWVALDLDGLPLPAGTDPRDLAACAHAVLPSLPPAFHRAAAVVQATASHGIKPGARLRLWYWLSRPTNGAELKLWLAKAPVDRSVFGGAQPIYTGRPAFMGGATDPIPGRLLLLPGEDVVEVPPAAVLASVRRVASPPPSLAAGGNRYALAALTRAVAQITTAAEGDRHASAKSAAWGLARLVKAGLLTEAEVSRAIGNAIAAAGKDAREGEAIVTWAIAHRPIGALPEGVR